MDESPWQLPTPLDAIIFDCDGTLSAIEGIDELARYNNVNKHVEELTRLAMENGAMNEQLYRERLQLVKPSYQHIERLIEDYIKYAIKNAALVIACLHELGKAVYVVSAGIYPAVVGFAERLGVLKHNIFAVPIYFDHELQYKDFDHQSPLINNNGKCQIVEEIKQQYPRVLLMGDGMNDVATKPLLNRFIGYGGAFARPHMAATEDFYIETHDLAALLPLCLTVDEMAWVRQKHSHLYQQAQQYLQSKHIIINYHEESA